jgi:uncharacterized membrane protein YgcG
MIPRNNPSRTGYKFDAMVAATPIAVLDAQVLVNNKVLALIDANFKDVSLNNTTIKTAVNFTYSQDSSGAQSIVVPSLSMINIPTFTFSSFNFAVSLEGRGFDASDNILVSPTIANSKFTTYNVTGQMIERGEPIGLTRLKGLLAESIVVKAIQAPPLAVVAIEKSVEKIIEVVKIIEEEKKKEEEKINPPPPPPSPPDSPGQSGSSGSSGSSGPSGSSGSSGPSGPSGPSGESQDEEKK